MMLLQATIFERLHCQTSCIRSSTLQQTSCHCIHVIMPVELQSLQVS